jgi:PPK2 family polyphosphate:nucleotide phosphotransferase
MKTKDYLADPGKFQLSRFRTDDTDDFRSKKVAVDVLHGGLGRLLELQEQLYAQDRYSLLLIFQGMDGAGKDSAIKHVMSGMNPNSTDVHAFKQPSTEELNHDFMWRSLKVLPERGRIGVFNRSYYEEVLVVRVHPELLDREKLPPPLVSKHVWEDRYQDIRDIERYLTRNGTVIRKFFLNLSKAEQRRRLLARLNDTAKTWKFSAADLAERARWRDYMRAYEDAIAATTTSDAPWYIVPADHKWFAHVLIAQVIIEALESMRLSYPKMSAAQRSELAGVKKALARSRD